jgi:hypothetical protein
LCASETPKPAGKMLARTGRQFPISLEDELAALTGNVYHCHFAIMKLKRWLV